MAATDRPTIRQRLKPGGLSTLADTLRGETTGGLLLVGALVLALLWSNSPWSASYDGLRALTFGPAALNLDLDLQTWAADGLLAIFFFVVGLELKREIVLGELRRFGTAVVPIAAAVGGMAVPAGLFLAFNLSSADGTPQGWAIPTATDIAFVVAILGVVGRKLPIALRAFLLTLAVVDDLLAITIIAIFYSDGVSVLFIGLAALAVAAFAVLVRRGVQQWWILLPLAFAAWALLHESGVHATIAGVALGMVVPAAGVAEHYEHRWRPISAGFAVPAFALLVSGVRIDGDSIAASLVDPVALGIVTGLAIGKPVGIVTATWLVCRFRHANLSPSLRWGDVVGAGMLAGIGFTVSLLIAELAFPDPSQGEHATLAVLAGSLISAVAGSIVLLLRGRRHERRATAADAQSPKASGATA